MPLIDLGLQIFTPGQKRTDFYRKVINNSGKTPGNGFWTVVVDGSDTVSDADFGNRQTVVTSLTVNSTADTDDTVWLEGP